MFAMKRPNNKVKTLDKLFGSEEFGGPDVAFWDDAGRRGRLRRSTSFESVLADPAMAKVVGSVRNLLTITSISTKPYGVTRLSEPTLVVVQPKPPAQAKVIGSVSHMLLQRKNTFSSTRNKSFGDVELLSNPPKTSTYKFNSSGEFKYPSPKKTNHNIFFDMLDKQREKRGSTEGRTSLVTAEETCSETEEPAQTNLDKRNVDTRIKPAFSFQRQQSESFLHLGPRNYSHHDACNADSKTRPTSSTDPRLNLQLNCSDHSSQQRRSRRRFGVHKIERQKDERESSTVKRAGSEPTLQTRSRRATSRHKNDLANPLGLNHHRVRQPLTRNKSETSIDRNALSNTQSRGRRIVIGLSKGEDDDEMHNAVADKQRRRRRHKTETAVKTDMTKRENNSSKSDIELEQDDLERFDDDAANSSNASFILPETIPFDDQLQSSDHSIDICDEIHGPHNQPDEECQRGHSRKHRKEKDRPSSQNNLKKNSSDKEIKIRRHDSKSRSKTESPPKSAISRNYKMDLLMHKLRDREEKKPNSFELCAHARCDFEKNGFHLNSERENFGFDFENNAFRSDAFQPFTKKTPSNIDEKVEGNGTEATGFEPPSLADDTEFLIKMLNTLDFPIIAAKTANDVEKSDSQGMVDHVPGETAHNSRRISTDENLGFGKGNSNHTTSSKASKRSRRTIGSRTSSKKSFSRTSSTKKIEWNDSASSISLGFSSGSQDTSED